MPLAWGAIIRLLLEGVVNWLRIKAAEAEIGLITVGFKLKEDVDAKEEEVKEEIRALRDAGRDHDADLLRDSFARRLQFSETVQRRISILQQKPTDSDP